MKRAQSLRILSRSVSTLPKESKKKSNIPTKVLVTGSSGQIGSELVPFLREKIGGKNVIASDIKIPIDRERFAGGPFAYCDVLDQDNLLRIVLEEGVDTIIHLGAILSAVGERNPQLALKVNMKGSENVLEVAHKNSIKCYIPSTIAVFGSNTPKINTPDDCIMRPRTMYGVNKLSLELLGEYYNRAFNSDFRAIRYPGIVSSESPPGGGTTDYAVDIYYHAVAGKPYVCYLKPDTPLPMMLMSDCLEGTYSLITADKKKLTRAVYNINGMTFTPEELTKSIQKYIPGFKVSYNIDPMRQAIADSWVHSLDDTNARKDFGYNPKVVTTDAMSEVMINALQKRLSETGSVHT